MAMGICIITGLREQNALASVFMLIWATCMMGLLTETYSRPHRTYDEATPNRPETYDFTRWQGDAKPFRPGVQWSQLADGNERCARMAYVQRRRRNFLLRMWPHTIGWFTYIAAFWIILSGFYDQLETLRREDRELWEDVPAFVPWAVFGTFLIFSTFAAPQIFLQWSAPSKVWMAEPIYCLLSLTSKVYLGWILLVYVIMKDDGVASLTLSKADANSTVE